MRKSSDDTHTNDNRTSLNVWQDNRRSLNLCIVAFAQQPSIVHPMLFTVSIQWPPPPMPDDSTLCFASMMPLVAAGHILC